ncbi:MAG: EAL domain-containing protein [Planctomyces sp.]|nr:EAL domain-containing protein [Planctomyces sp.]
MLFFVLHYYLDLLAFLATAMGIAAYIDAQTQKAGALRRGRLITWGLTLSLALIGTAAAHWTCEYQRSRLKASIEGLAPTYAIELENAGHENVGLDTDPSDPLYLRLIERQRDWLTANQAVADIYTLKKTPDGRMAFVVDSETDYNHDGLFLGEIESRTKIGEIYEDTPDKMYEALAGKVIFDDVPITDKWGTWVGTYVPMRNSKGQVDAILGVDFPASHWLFVLVLNRGGVLGVFLALIAGYQVAILQWYQNRAEIRFHREVAIQKQAQAQALEDAIRRLRAYELVIDAHTSLSITDHRGILTHVNEKFCELSGFEWEELIGRSPSIVKSGYHSRSFWETVWSTMLRGQAWRGEICNRNRTGELYWVDTTIVPYKDATDTITQFISVGTDITARKKFEAELLSAARVDKLTGLPNRALIQDRLRQAIDRSRRVPSYLFAVMFMDFDRFKLVNDCLGHDVGDMLLQQIAGRLSNLLRSGDSLAVDASGTTVARLGGDEFVILLDGISRPTDVSLVAERILTACDTPYQIGEHLVRSSASIGIVCSDPRYKTAEEMLRDADIAMYEAKAQGKARFVIFDSSMQQAVHERVQIETDMRAGVGTDQFFLRYQPIIGLEDRILRGAEALVRWKHPVRGEISPVNFIPIAEETRLILPLTVWIMEQACWQFMQWKTLAPDRCPDYMSVNLSRVQFSEPGIVREILRIIEASGMKASELQLEVTESEIMSNRESAIEILRSLKAFGFRLAMDDFGTGHSSLACLHQFPFDVIKIDRAFIANLAHGRTFIALANAVVTLAENLGLTCVAEGIETFDQIVLLQSMGCRCGQGYYFGRPVSPEDFISGNWAGSLARPKHLEMLAPEASQAVGI